MRSPLSLLQETAKRAMQIADAKDIIVIASQKYQDVTFQQLSEIDKDLCKNIILEPCQKNTAAAISVATIHAAHNHTNPVVCVMPSDHFIADTDELVSTIKESLIVARRGHIILFGVTPTRADNNFGYILGEENSDFEDIFAVNSFVEKPSLATLKMIMNCQKKWWNSGIYLMSTRAFFSDIKRNNMDILKNASDAYSGLEQSDYGYVIDGFVYNSIKSISVDKAIMEDCKNLLLSPLDAGWADIGSWQSVWELSQQEGLGTPLENFLDKIARAC
jgi:mannose-1-phosphate guanylyltransferase